MDEEVSRAMVEAMDLMCRLRPEGWVHHHDGFLVGVTGVPLPTLNGVVCWDADAVAEQIESALAEVGRAGVPRCLLFPPGADGLRGPAAAAGLEHAEDLRLMRLDEEPEDAAPAGLTLRQLTPTELATHVRLAAEGFGAPVELFDDLVGPVAGDERVVILAGEVDGEPVTTGLGLLQGESVAVYNVATPPAHRGHGFGAAVTAAVVREGRRRGARWAWLQPSEQGYSVYERLGFRQVGVYECWTSAAPG